jgi:CHAD domain-containing protein
MIPRWEFKFPVIRLLWMLLEMNTLTSDLYPQCLTMEDFSQKTIVKFVRKISRYKVAVLQDTDPEALHKMRVSMRRLGSILQVLEPVMILPKACNYRSIGELATVLGSVRDLDVVMENLQDVGYQELSEHESLALKEISAVLSHRRQKAFRKLKICLAKEYQVFIIACHRWLKKPKYRSHYIASQCISSVLPDLLSPKVTAFFLHDAWSIVERKGGKCELTMHDLRKHIKGIRYQIEYFFPCFNADPDPFLPLLETTQELLGEMQDELIIGELLKNIVGEKGVKELPVLSNFLNGKTLQAWEDWQLVRSQLCNQDWRRSLRMALV